MKYRYKNTEIVVESSIPLDSAMFTEVKPEAAKTAPEPVKKPATRRTVKKQR